MAKMLNDPFWADFDKRIAKKKLAEGGSVEDDVERRRKLVQQDWEAEKSARAAEVADPALRSDVPAAPGTPQYVAPQPDSNGVGEQAMRGLDMGINPLGTGLPSFDRVMGNVESLGPAGLAATTGVRMLPAAYNLARGAQLFDKGGNALRGAARAARQGWLDEAVESTAKVAPKLAEKVAKTPFQRVKQAGVRALGLTAGTVLGGTYLNDVLDDRARAEIDKNQAAEAAAKEAAAQAAAEAAQARRPVSMGEFPVDADKVRRVDTVDTPVYERKSRENGVRYFSNNPADPALYDPSAMTGAKRVGPSPSATPTAMPYAPEDAYAAAKASGLTDAEIASRSGTIGYDTLTRTPGSAFADIQARQAASAGLRLSQVAKAASEGLIHPEDGRIMTPDGMARYLTQKAQQEGLRGGGGGDGAGGGAAQMAMLKFMADQQEKAAAAEEGQGAKAEAWITDKEIPLETRIQAYRASGRDPLLKAKVGQALRQELSESLQGIAPEAGFPLRYTPERNQYVTKAIPGQPISFKDYRMSGKTWGPNTPDLVNHFIPESWKRNYISRTIDPKTGRAVHFPMSGENPKLEEMYREILEGDRVNDARGLR